VNPEGTQVAIVAVNMGTAAQSFPLTLDLGTFGAVTPYRTSATENMAALPQIAGGSGTIQVTVEPQSVTTFTSSI